MEGGGGGGGGASPGGSGSGSMTTVSKEDNQLVLSSEESSSYQGESELELGLGLSLGCGGGGSGLKAKSALTTEQSPWGQYARILTAEDFPSMASKPSSAKNSAPSSLSSSSSSSVTKASNLSAGFKRSADSISPPRSNGGVSNQVVGWPPIRAYRMNSLVNQAKMSATEEFHSTVGQTKNKDAVVDMTHCVSHKKNLKDKRQLKTSLFVKVNMDGNAIGRKVDLNVHSNYESLAKSLEDMFCKPTAAVNAGRPVKENHDLMTEAAGPISKLLDGSSDFVLTYEDKEGDWMLVGDVPWGMFLSFVKRLRIMRTSEANGLGPRFQERNGIQSKHV